MRHPILASTIVGVAALAMAACANPRAEQALQARATLVGLSEQALLSCAGVPDRSRTAGGQSFFTYETATFDAYGRSYAGAFGAYRGYYPGYGFGFGVPLATTISSRYCEATFTIEDGRVVQVVYNTPYGSGGRGVAECYDIVQNCMAYASAAPAG